MNYQRFSMNSDNSSLSRKKEIELDLLVLDLSTRNRLQNFLRHHHLEKDMFIGFTISVPWNSQSYNVIRRLEEFDQRPGQIAKSVSLNSIYLLGRIVIYHLEVHRNFDKHKIYYLINNSRFRPFGLIGRGTHLRTGEESIPRVSLG